MRSSRLLSILFAASVVATVTVFSTVAIATASPAVASEREAERRNARPATSSRFDAPKHDSRTPAAPSVQAPGPQSVKDPPVRVRTATAKSSTNGASPGTGKVNINTADVKQLMTLTGVGRKVAENIVEYRDTHGPFKKADDLRKVEGVGTGLWEKNRERIVTK